MAFDSKWNQRGKPIIEYQIDEYQMTWAFMIIAWGGCIFYIPVNIMIPSTGCILGPFSNFSKNVS